MTHTGPWVFHTSVSWHVDESLLYYSSTWSPGVMYSEGSGSSRTSIALKTAMTVSKIPPTRISNHLAKVGLLGVCSSSFRALRAKVKESEIACSLRSYNVWFGNLHTGIGPFGVNDSGLQSLGFPAGSGHVYIASDRQSRIDGLGKIPCQSDS
jgi:hypothetical protein